jgi:hypothetical protein
VTEFREHVHTGAEGLSFQINTNCYLHMVKMCRKTIPLEEILTIIERLACLFLEKLGKATTKL